MISVLFVCRRRERVKKSEKSSCDYCLVIYISVWRSINNKEAQYPLVVQWSQDI